VVDSWGAEGGHVSFGIDRGGLVGVLVVVNCTAEAGTQCGFVVCCFVL
jgi:hypothetical protein